MSHGTYMMRGLFLLSRSILDSSFHVLLCLKFLTWILLFSYLGICMSAAAIFMMFFPHSATQSCSHVCLDLVSKETARTYFLLFILYLFIKHRLTSYDMIGPAQMHGRFSTKTVLYTPFFLCSYLFSSTFCLLTYIEK